MIFHALLTHFDVLIFHKIEYFTFIFMYYLIYLLGFSVIDKTDSTKYKLLFSYATIHIIFSVALIFNYVSWLSPENLLIHVNGEIYRIGSGIFLIYAFNKIKSSIPSPETKQVKNLWMLAGVFIVLIGIQTLAITGLLMIDYRMELVTLNINILGVLALLLIFTISYIVLKYPTAFIISHTQVFKALKLYENFDDYEPNTYSEFTLMDYLSKLSEQYENLEEFKKSK